MRGTLAGGGKVLWVSNTVERCRRVAEEWECALTYHSRFRYRDRVERHRDVVEAFRRPGPALATTTQVCEMSLDLSADLLVTDLAPVPALIQRLGRLNRRSTSEEPAPVKPFVVLPFSGLPYESGELDAASRWIDALGGGRLSQRELVEAWVADDLTPPDAGPSAWLDGGFVTEVAPLREASPGITVLLESDAADVKRGVVNAVEVALPMNPPRSVYDWRTWPRVRFFPVAPSTAIEYDPKRGARWTA